MVPEGWAEDALSKLLEKVIDYRGKSVPKAASGVPLITARNVRDGYLDFEHQEFIGTEAFEGWMSRGTPRDGDILFTTEAPLGQACRFPKSGKYAVGQRTVVLRAAPARLHPDFLLQFLLSNHGKRQIDIKSTGSTAKGIKSSELKKVRVLHPKSLVEQQKVTDLLSNWEKAIGLCSRLIGSAHRQKKALAQQLLTGKRRLSDFSDEWKNRRIDKLCDRVQRRDDGEPHPILMISSTRGWVRQDDMYSRYMAGESAKSYVLLKRGEFAYNKGNSKTYACGCVFPLKSFETGLVPHVYVCFRFKGDIEPRFYEHYFAADMLARQLTRVINTGVRNNGLLNIRPADFLACEVPVPSVKEQTAISDVLDGAARQVELYKAIKEKLELEKRALMQQLLTGKRRVKLPPEHTTPAKEHAS